MQNMTILGLYLDRYLLIIFIFNYFDNTYFCIVKREDLIILDDKVLNSQDIKLACTNPYFVISMIPIK